jgi:hypothetical protein
MLHFRKINTKNTNFTKRAKKLFVWPQKSKVVGLSIFLPMGYKKLFWWKHASKTILEPLGPNIGEV